MFGETARAALERLQKSGLCCDDNRKVHILGAGRREAGFSPSEAKGNFETLVDRELLLCGPNMQFETSGEQGIVGSRSLYHEMEQSERPLVVFAFNAGVWGYDSWGPSVVKALLSGAPLVVTSYNEMEAELDEDALLEMCAALGCPVRHEWRAEANPFASTTPLAENKTNHEMFENGYWQCLVAAQ